MEESSKHEYNSNDKRKLSSLSKENPLFPKIIPENLSSLDSFFIFPLKSEESSLFGIKNENQDKNFVNQTEKTEQENTNITININNSDFGASESFGFPNEPIKLFKTSKILSKDSGKKFSGRKRRNPIFEDKIEKMHDKYNKDNIITKIQVYAMNSITGYINEIVSKIDLGLGYIPKFNKIDYSYKRVINGSAFAANKIKTIGNLLEVDSSPKYRNFARDHNKQEYEKIINNEIVKKILSQKYIDFFKEVFYKNERIIDLSKFGLRKIIRLSNKVKLYESMFKGENDNKYRIRVEEIIRKKFF